MLFFFQVVIGVLCEFLKFNVVFDGNDIVYKEDIYFGMVVVFDWGLIVLVIYNVDYLNFVGFVVCVNDLVECVCIKQFKLEEVQSGIFMVINLGVFGSFFGMLLINQLQVVILCIGMIEKCLVVVIDVDGNDLLVICLMVYFVFSYDYCLIDGVDVEVFMVCVKEIFEMLVWEEFDVYVGS